MNFDICIHPYTTTTIKVFSLCWGCINFFFCPIIFFFFEVLDFWQPLSHYLTFAYIPLCIISLMWFFQSYSILQVKGSLFHLFCILHSSVYNTKYKKDPQISLGCLIINCKEIFKTNATWSSRETWRRSSTNKKGIGITRKRRLEKGNNCLLTTACLLAEFGGKTDMPLQLCEGPGLLELSVRVSYIWDRLISLCHICLPLLLFTPLVNSEQVYSKPASWEQ